MNVVDKITKFLDKIVRSRQYIICITQTSPIGIQYFGFGAFNASLTEIGKVISIPDEENKRKKKRRKLNIELRDINNSLMPIGAAASSGNIIIALNISFRSGNGKGKDDEKNKFFSNKQNESVNLVMMVVGEKYLIKLNDLTDSFKKKKDGLKLSYESRLKKMTKDNNSRIDEIVSNYELMIEEYRREIEISTQKRVKEHLKSQDRAIKSILSALAEVKKTKGLEDDLVLDEKFEVAETKSVETAKIGTSKDKELDDDEITDPNTDDEDDFDDLLNDKE